MTQENEKLHDFSPDDYDLFPNNEAFKDGSEPEIAWIDNDNCIIVSPDAPHKLNARIDLVLGCENQQQMYTKFILADFDEKKDVKRLAMDIATDLLIFLQELPAEQWQRFLRIALYDWRVCYYRPIRP